MKPFPEAFGGPLAIKAKCGAGRTEEEFGIAADGAMRGGQVLGEVGRERGRMAAREAPESAAPLPNGGSRERGAAPGAPKIFQDRPLGTAFEEDSIEDRAADLDRVVGAGLLEAGEGPERAAVGALATVALDADMRDDGVAENEVTEVVTVLHEAAVGSAYPALIGTCQYQSPFARQPPGELAIVLERTGTGAYFVRDVPSCARVTRLPNRVARALFYLETEGGYVTGGEPGMSTNPAGAHCLSQSGTFAQN